MSATIYGDADWLAPSGALGIGIRFQDGHLAWSDATGSTIAADATGADAAAARLLIEYSNSIVAGLPNDRAVAVIGSGAVADLVRRQLSSALLGATERPAAIAVLASAPDAVERALRQVSDLGTVVLACPVQIELVLNLYEDLHRRGLTLVGIPRPHSGTTEPRTSPFVAEMLATLVDLGHQAHDLPHQGWFRLSD